MLSIAEEFSLLNISRKQLYNTNRRKRRRVCVALNDSREKNWLSGQFCSNRNSRRRNSNVISQINRYFFYHRWHRPALHLGMTNHFYLNEHRSATDVKIERKIDMLLSAQNNSCLSRWTNSSHGILTKNQSGCERFFLSTLRSFMHTPRCFVQTNLWIFIHV